MYTKKKNIEYNRKLADKISSIQKTDKFYSYLMVNLSISVGLKGKNVIEKDKEFLRVLPDALRIGKIKISSLESIKVYKEVESVIIPIEKKVSYMAMLNAKDVALSKLSFAINIENGGYTQDRYKHICDICDTIANERGVYKKYGNKNYKWILASFTFVGEEGVIKVADLKIPTNPASAALATFSEYIDQYHKMREVRLISIIERSLDYISDDSVIEGMNKMRKDAFIYKVRKEDFIYEVGREDLIYKFNFTSGLDSVIYIKANNYQLRNPVAFMINKNLDKYIFLKGD